MSQRAAARKESDSSAAARVLQSQRLLRRVLDGRVSLDVATQWLWAQSRPHREQRQLPDDEKHGKLHPSKHQTNVAQRHAGGRHHAFDIHQVDYFTFGRMVLNFVRDQAQPFLNGQPSQVEEETARKDTVGDVVETQPSSTAPQPLESQPSDDSHDTASWSMESPPPQMPRCAPPLLSADSESLDGPDQEIDGFRLRVVSASTPQAAHAQRRSTGSGGMSSVYEFPVRWSTPDPMDAASGGRRSSASPALNSVPEAETVESTDDFNMDTPAPGPNQRVGRHATKRKLAFGAPALGVGIGPDDGMSIDAHHAANRHGIDTTKHPVADSFFPIRVSSALYAAVVYCSLSPQLATEVHFISRLLVLPTTLRLRHIHVRCIFAPLLLRLYAPADFCLFDIATRIQPKRITLFARSSQCVFFASDCLYRLLPVVQCLGSPITGLIRDCPNVRLIHPQSAQAWRAVHERISSWEEEMAPPASASTVPVSLTQASSMGDVDDVFAQGSHVGLGGEAGLGIDADAVGDSHQDFSSNVQVFHNREKCRDMFFQLFRHFHAAPKWNAKQLEGTRKQLADGVRQLLGVMHVANFSWFASLFVTELLRHCWIGAPAPPSATLGNVGAAGSEPSVLRTMHRSDNVGNPGPKVDLLQLQRLERRMSQASFPTRGQRSSSRRVGLEHNAPSSGAGSHAQSSLTTNVPAAATETSDVQSSISVPRVRSKRSQQHAGKRPGRGTQRKGRASLNHPDVVHVVASHRRASAKVSSRDEDVADPEEQTRRGEWPSLTDPSSRSAPIKPRGRHKQIQPHVHSAEARHASAAPPATDEPAIFVNQQSHRQTRGTNNDSSGESASVSESKTNSSIGTPVVDSTPQKDMRMFSVSEEFFHSVLEEGDSFRLNSHIVNDLCARIAQFCNVRVSRSLRSGGADTKQTGSTSRAGAEAVQFNWMGGNRGKRGFSSSEAKQYLHSVRASFSARMLKLRILGRFLGFLCSCPHWPLSRLVEQEMKRGAGDSVGGMFATLQRQISVLESHPFGCAVALDINAYLTAALHRGCLVLVVPWITEFVAMTADDLVFRSTVYFQKTFRLLCCAYRTAFASMCALSKRGDVDNITGQAGAGTPAHDRLFSPSSRSVTSSPGVVGVSSTDSITSLPAAWLSVELPALDVAVAGTHGRDGGRSPGFRTLMTPPPGSNTTGGDTDTETGDERMEHRAGDLPSAAKFSWQPSSLQHSKHRQHMTRQNALCVLSCIEELARVLSQARHVAGAHRLQLHSDAPCACQGADTGDAQAGMGNAQRCLFAEPCDACASTLSTSTEVRSSSPPMLQRSLSGSADSPMEATLAATAPASVGASTLSRARSMVHTRGSQAETPRSQLVGATSNHTSASGGGASHNWLWCLDSDLQDDSIPPLDCVDGLCGGILMRISPYFEDLRRLLLSCPPDPTGRSRDDEDVAVGSGVPPVRVDATPNVTQSLHVSSARLRPRVINPVQPTTDEVTLTNSDASTVAFRRLTDSGSSEVLVKNVMGTVTPNAESFPDISSQASPAAMESSDAHSLSVVEDDAAVEDNMTADLDTEERERQQRQQRLHQIQRLFFQQHPSLSSLATMVINRVVDNAVRYAVQHCVAPAVKDGLALFEQLSAAEQEQTNDGDSQGPALASISSTLSGSSGLSSLLAAGIGTGTNDDVNIKVPPTVAHSLRPRYLELTRTINRVTRLQRLVQSRVCDDVAVAAAVQAADYSNGRVGVAMTALAQPGQDDSVIKQAIDLALPYCVEQARPRAMKKAREGAVKGLAVHFNKHLRTLTRQQAAILKLPSLPSVQEVSEVHILSETPVGTASDPSGGLGSVSQIGHRTQSLELDSLQRSLTQLQDLLGAHLQRSERPDAPPGDIDTVHLAAELMVALSRTMDQWTIMSTRPTQTRTGLDYNRLLGLAFLTVRLLVVVVACAGGCGGNSKATQKPFVWLRGHLHVEQLGHTTERAQEPTAWCVCVERTLGCVARALVYASDSCGHEDSNVCQTQLAQLLDPSFLRTMGLISRTRSVASRDPLVTHGAHDAAIIIGDASMIMCRFMAWLAQAGVVSVHAVESVWMQVLRTQLPPVATHGIHVSSDCGQHVALVALNVVRAYHDVHGAQSTLTECECVDGKDRGTQRQPFSESYHHLNFSLMLDVLSRLTYTADQGGTQTVALAAASLLRDLQLHN